MRPAGKCARGERRADGGSNDAFVARLGRTDYMSRDRGGEVYRATGPVTAHGAVCVGLELISPSQDAMQGRNVQPRSTDIASFLRQAGLRPTRQRLALGQLLFGSGDRHVSAEMLHAEATAMGEQVSLATVYNTLHQFKHAGLLRELAIEGAKTYFDTNTSNHSHFLLEPEGQVIDIPSDQITVTGLPQPPEGMRISHVDVVVRLVKS